MASITDPRLATGIDIINGEKAKLVRFELSQQYLGTLLVGAKKQKTLDQRRIAGLNQVEDDDSYYKTKCWSKDTHCDVDKVDLTVYRKYPSGLKSMILVLHNGKKKKSVKPKRKIGSLTLSDKGIPAPKKKVVDVNASGNTDGSTVKSSKPKDAEAQFGKGAHKEKK